MSVKREKRTSSASKKARGGARAAGSARPSASGKATAAKARPKKARAKKAAPKKTAPRRPAAKAGAPKAAAPAKARRKTARPADAGAPGPLDIVDLAPIRVETHHATPHGDASRRASDGPGAQMPPTVPPTPMGRPASPGAGKGVADGGEAHEGPPRANKLVPTNAVHTTKRRNKQSFWQSPTFGAVAAVLVLVLLVVGYRPEPPEIAPMEQRADAGPASDAPSEAAPAPSVEPPRAAPAPITDPVQAAPNRPWPTRTASVPQRATQIAAAPADASEDTAVAARPGPMSESGWSGLHILELVEMEQMLARLDLGPSQADGIVDRKTESAIRMYQQIAGLPVDGEPSLELLDDMRAVVKMLDGEN